MKSGADYSTSRRCPTRRVSRRFKTPWTRTQRLFVSPLPNSGEGPWLSLIVLGPPPSQTFQIHFPLSSWASRQQQHQVASAAAQSSSISSVQPVSPSAIHFSLNGSGRRRTPLRRPGQSHSDLSYPPASTRWPPVCADSTQRLCWRGPSLDICPRTSLTGTDLFFLGSSCRPPFLSCSLRGARWDTTPCDESCAARVLHALGHSNPLMLLRIAAVNLSSSRPASWRLCSASASFSSHRCRRSRRCRHC